MKAKLNSINLVSARPEKLRNFYVDILRLEENRKRSHPPGFFYLEGGSGCNILIQQAGYANTAPGSVGFELGIEVDSLEDYEDLIKKNDCKIISEKQQMGWGRGITIADPEGHIINIYQFQ